MSEEKPDAMKNKTGAEATPPEAESSRKDKIEAKAAKGEAKSDSMDKAKKLSPKKPVKAEEEGSIWMSRRNFFSRAGWAAFFSFVGTMLIGSLRFMFPRVLFEPSPVFKAGYPDDYPVGTVSTKWIKDQRVWIVHNEEGIYAIFAQCTHLGCTPRWLDAENKFKCPCHGSGFTRAGINFEGPAPRPLERIQVTLAEDGELLLNKSIRFREEKGEWGRPGSILHV
ncbi:MAG: Rieske 2Fe-2S domain-containing protein [bacterium]